MDLELLQLEHELHLLLLAALVNDSKNDHTDDHKGLGVSQLRDELVGGAHGRQCLGLASVALLA